MIHHEEREEREGKEFKELSRRVIGCGIEVFLVLFVVKKGLDPHRPLTH